MVTAIKAFPPARPGMFPDFGFEFCRVSDLGFPGVAFQFFWDETCAVVVEPPLAGRAARREIGVDRLAMLDRVPQLVR